MAGERCKMGMATHQIVDGDVPVAIGQALPQKTQIDLAIAIVNKPKTAVEKA